MKRIVLLVILAIAVLALSLPASALKICLDTGAPIDSNGNITIDADALQASDTQYVRINFILYPWSSIYDTTPHGSQNLTWRQTYDNIVNSLTSRGISVYALVGFSAMPWSNNVDSDSYVIDYASNFASIVGMFKDRVRVYESFNEPNAGATPAVPAARFAQMLKSIYTNVKINHSSDPSWQVTLVSGPLSSGSSPDGSDATYLKAVYDGGIASYDWNGFKTTYGTYPLDGIGYHTYPAYSSSKVSTVTNALNAQLNRIWNIVTTYEGTSTTKKMWISEFGWTCYWVTEAGQASNLTTAFNIFKNDTRVAFASWFQITDFSATDKWGLFRASPFTQANKRPSWTSFNTFATSMTGVSGTVRDSSGNAVSGASVSVTPGSYSATTASNGTYSITGMMGGTYTATASKSGNSQTVNSVSVTPNNMTQVDFNLTDSTPPTNPVVTDDGSYQTNNASLHFSWTASDPESGIAEYKYAITDGISIIPGGDWLSTGTTAQATRTGLSLLNGQIYYGLVQARNGAGLWSGTGVSDGVAIAKPVSSIGLAKAEVNGTFIALSGRVVTASFPNSFYAEDPDRTGGILIPSPGPVEGTLVNAAGYLSVVNGERQLSGYAVTNAGSSTAPSPLALPNKAIGGNSLNAFTPGVTGGTGLNNIGLLVRTWGIAETVGTGYFTITDGSGFDLKVTLPSGVTIPNLAPYTFAFVTGISSVDNGDRLIKARKQADVEVK